VESSRPNLLLFMPDQLRSDVVGCFGSPVGGTPHTDALAARGTRFSHAYSQHSVCSPSRVSMMTGWYPHVAGHRTLTNLLNSWEPNLLGLLHDAGFHVAWAGERGDTFAAGVADEVCDRRGFTVVPEELLHPSPYPHDSAWYRAHYHGRREGGSTGRSGAGDDTAVNNVLDFDEATVRTAIDWLCDGLPEPWVLFVALMFPHPPFVAEEPWFSMHDRASMPAPAPWRAHGKPEYMVELRDRTGTGLLAVHDWQEIAATYYGMVSRVDDQLGRVLSAVDRAGHGERTMTWFFTDHGEYLGDHGLVEKWPSGLHDCLLRNPLVVAGPGVAEDRRYDGMTEMVDLLPTMLEIAGIEPSHTHFGRSLVAALGGTDGPHRDYAFSEGGFLVEEEHLLERARPPYDIKANLQHDRPTTVGKATSVRDKRYTYVHRAYEGPELYDRVADPGETVNMAGNNEYDEVVQRLRDALLDWSLSTSDVIPWQPDSRFESSFVSLFERRQPD
jgi:arylsulfatase A-like enzyme